MDAASRSDTIDSFDQLDTAVRRIGKLDGQRRQVAKQFVRNTEVDGQALKLISEIDESTLRRLTDLDDGTQFRQALARQNTRLRDGIESFSEEDVDALTRTYLNLESSRDGELSTEEIDKLGEALGTANNVDVGPRKDPSDVVANLEYLSKRGVDGFVDAGGTPESRYRGIAGEPQLARQRIEDGVDPSDVEIGKQVEQSDLDVPDDLQLLPGDPDSDLKTGTDIDTNITDGIAYESKNTRAFRPLFDAPQAYQSVGENLNSLRQKLNTYAAVGQDEIVVVVHKGQLGEYDETVRQQFPSKVKDIESLDGGENSLAARIESNFDETSVEFKTFDEVTDNNGR